MNVNGLDAIVRRAREEAPPPVDVSARVIRTLRAPACPGYAASPRHANRTLVWFAATSMAVAASVTVVAISAEAFASDPWMAMLFALSGGVL
jgi:hypothetical protein